MSIRRQLFEHRLSAGNIPMLDRDSHYEFSLFFHKFGRYMTTKGAEFLVIKNIGCSKFLMSAKSGQPSGDYSGYVQLRINTSDYFQYPDGSRCPGLSNKASPYPFEHIISSNIMKSDMQTVLADMDEALADIPDIYEMPIYLLPGQNYDIIFTRESGKFEPDDYVDIAMEYELWDGSDSVIANQLLEMGLSVTLENVDYVKRDLVGECNHPQFCIAYARKGFAGIDMAELNPADLLSWHGDGDNNDNSEVHIEGDSEYRLYCNLCRKEFPFVAFEKDRLDRKWKLPKESKYNVRTNASTTRL